MALDCSSAELPACLRSALSLVPEIRNRIESQQLARQRALVDRYEEYWLRPFMPDRGWQSHSNGLVDHDSLLALVSLSDIFAALEPLSTAVSAERSQKLLELLDDARAAVQQATDLPADLRTAVMSRLHDVQWAIEHYNVHGPEGLQAALDRLGAEMARTSQRRGPWRKKVGTALMYGSLVLFMHLDDVVANVEAADTIIQEVGDWAQHARDLLVPDRLELPSADAASPHDDAGTEDVIDAELVEEAEDHD
jgi:hypothetical protein